MSISYDKVKPENVALVKAIKGSIGNKYPSGEAKLCAALVDHYPAGYTDNMVARKLGEKKITPEIKELLANLHARGIVHSTTHSHGTVYNATNRFFREVTKPVRTHPVYDPLYVGNIEFAKTVLSKDKPPTETFATTLCKALYAKYPGTMDMKEVNTLGLDYPSNWTPIQVSEQMYLLGIISVVPWPNKFAYKLSDAFYEALTKMGKEQHD